MADQNAAGEAKRGGGCLKAAGIGLAVIVGLGVLGTVVGGGDAPDQQPAVTAGPPLAVTADELRAAFEANEVAAKAAFDGRRLAVTGTISGVTLDFMDEPVVELATDNEFLSVQAKFRKEDTAATSALAKGDEITVVCGRVTEVIGAPILDDCTLP